MECLDERARKRACRPQLFRLLAEAVLADMPANGSRGSLPRAEMVAGLPEGLRKFADPIEHEIPVQPW